MPPKVYVKVCGLCSTEDASLAVSYGADLLGMVFHQGSSRAVPAETAIAIKERHPDKPRVLVFGHDPEEAILKIYHSLRDMLTYIQVPSDHKGLDKLIETVSLGKLMPAIAVEDHIDQEGLSRFDDCPLVIFDTAKGRRIDGTIDAGGSGKAFDWNLLKTIERPYLLAGGLNPMNLQEALELLDPLGVDVSSGIETSAGIKDPKKMRTFIEIAEKFKRPLKNQ